MYSFDGEFRSRPQQSYGGTKNYLSRSELLRQANLKRQDRENARRLCKAAIVLQAYTRGWTARKQQKVKNGQRFDQLQQECVHNEELLAKPQTWVVLFQTLLSQYEQTQDTTRLLWMAQTLLKHIEKVIFFIESDPTVEWSYRLARLLSHCLGHIAYNSSLPVAVPLRVLETFTQLSRYSNEQRGAAILEKVWSYLVGHGFFKDWSHLYESRVPNFLNHFDPHHYLATSLLELLLRMLRFGPTHKVVPSFLKEVLSSGPWSEKFRNYLFPKLVEQEGILKPPDLIEAALSVIESGSSSLWLLYALLTLLQPHLDTLTFYQGQRYLAVLKPLVHMLHSKSSKGISFSTYSETSDSSEDESSSQSSLSCVETQITEQCLRNLNSDPTVTFCCKLVAAVEEKEGETSAVISPLATICHSLLLSAPNATFPPLPAALVFRPSFLRLLWKEVLTVPASLLYGNPTSVLQKLARGVQLTGVEKESFLPLLTLFCAFLSHLLPTLYDEELFHESNGTHSSSSPSVLPFGAEELAGLGLVLRDVCLGLIELSFPDTRTSFLSRSSSAVTPSEARHWKQLFKKSVSLLRQLYLRDARRPFCPPNHWIAQHISIPTEKPSRDKFNSRSFHGHTPFIGPQHFTREELEDEGPPMTTTEVRNLTILRELPFVVPFHTRIKIFQSLLNQDKEVYQGQAHYLMGPMIQVAIRRNYIYEDAFNKLSPDKHPNAKLAIRIQLINAVGLDEPGVDGGGIFREFLNELLKTAFDPTRGLFAVTTDRQLYPNPAVKLLFPDYNQHYYFIGRMLGKAIYENMLLELPLADFFLAKLLQKSNNVDIHHLASLDPVIYKNLLYLKRYDGDVSDLGLDFTVLVSELGENKTVALKPGGSDICVTAENRIEYVHLMADFKLNKEIRQQCASFKEGLASVIDLAWLRMFDHRELQTLISGAHAPVDVDDLRRHTQYTNGYSDEHPLIQAFWAVVESFTETQRRQLLRFVTSCSRPPLLGFRELNPAFCIQRAPYDSERLPTASTCMNLLKLPEFPDLETLRAKLIYAIEAGAGFELS